MKLYDYLLTFWVQIRDLYMYVFRRAIIVNGYVDDHTWRGIRHRNWGDDLNYYFLQELTERPVVFYHNFKLAKWLHLNNYMCIGTILDNYASRCNYKTIVWGSGSVGKKWAFDTPYRICAIRGEYTYSFLKSNEIDCPRVYGDPALLLPLVYLPKKKASPSAFPYREGSLKRYRLGIIPHVVDLRHPVIEEIREKYTDEILIIDLARYQKWIDVIDQICSCERILSSSLHGIIVSDAYQVPNCWITLSGKVLGGYFKYYDYFSSVNREIETPIVIQSYQEIKKLVEGVYTIAEHSTIKEIQNNLISVAPFSIKQEVQS